MIYCCKIMIIISRGMMMTKNKPFVTPILKREQIIRLGRLIHMEYRPSEIADLLGVHVDTVRRSYLQAGCPHRRDEHGHIWIIGTAFRSWAEEVIAERKRKTSQPMAEDEAWCMKCNKRIKITNPNIKPVNHYLELVQTVCEACGSIVNRGRAKTN